MLNSSRLFKILFNFACIYLIWGSTYLAIKFALISFAPFLMAGLRFMTGGLILLGLGRLRREPGLANRDLKYAVMSGILLAVGNALVCLCEVSFASGVVAVMVGTMPAWIMLLNWRVFGGLKPQLHQFAGVVLSLFGVAALTSNSSGDSDLHNWVAWAAILAAVLSWAFGTLIQRKGHSRDALFTFVGAQIFSGSLVLLMIWSVVSGPRSFHPELVTTTAVWSVAYLAIFGSVIAYTSYLWLNREVDPSLVSTYALANPVVAVVLGWLFLGEPITGMTLVSSVLVVTGLLLILLKDRGVFARWGRSIAGRRRQPARH